MKFLIYILVSRFFFKMEGFKVVLLILSVLLMTLIEASSDSTTQTEGMKAGKSKLLLLTFFRLYLWFQKSSFQHIFCLFSFLSFFNRPVQEYRMQKPEYNDQRTKVSLMFTINWEIYTLMTRVSLTGEMNNETPSAWFVIRPDSLSGKNHRITSIGSR